MPDKPPVTDEESKEEEGKEEEEETEEEDESEEEIPVPEPAFEVDGNKSWDVDDADFNFDEIAGGGTSRNGGSLGSYDYTSTGPYGKGMRVLGMPFNFNPNDDVGNRVYNQTFKTDVPFVFILPGKPAINKKLFGTPQEGGHLDISFLWAGANKIGNALGNFGNHIITGKRSWRDPRWMKFIPKYTEYASVLHQLIVLVGAQMGIKEAGNIGGLNLNETYGLAYYATKGTSISESAQNDYAAPDIAREANDKQAQIRQGRMYAEVGGGTMADVASKWISEMAHSLADVPVIGGFIAAMTENLDGAQLYYPDVWQNSSFERSYNLEFKFFSPYGDPVSVFNYVYLPFLSLLAMSLPIQFGYSAYNQPFVLSISAPGLFECDMGIVMSMTIDRGGDALWTIDRLPREITVRMSVRDMYPNLMLPRGSSETQWNISLLSYVECLAGLRVGQLSSVGYAGEEAKTAVFTEGIIGDVNGDLREAYAVKLAEAKAIEEAKKAAGVEETTSTLSKKAP